MNTDSTPGRPGSSGDASPGDLSQRLRSDLDVRAMRVEPAAPPLSDILHRSRRRRNRHRAAGVLAGAGAMTLAGVAVLVRPGDDEPAQTELAAGPDEGTATTTTPPGTVPADAQFFANGMACGPNDSWYLGPDGPTPQLMTSSGVSVAGGNWTVYVNAAGGGAYTRVFLGAADDLSGPALAITRVTSPNVISMNGGTVVPPVPAAPDIAVDQVSPVALGAAPPGRVVSIGAAEAYLYEANGTVELSWTVGPDFVRLAGKGVSSDTVIAVAQSLQLRGGGGLDIGTAPSELPVSLESDRADGQGLGGSTFFQDANGQPASVSTILGSRADMVAQIVGIGASKIERVQVNGHEAWLASFGVPDPVLGGPYPAQQLFWYDEGRGGFASLSAPMIGTPTSDLVAIASGLHDLSPAEIQAACDAQAKREADARAAAAAAASSSPWIDDGSSSPWIAPGDGSSSPWTTDPGPASEWIDPADPNATATTAPPPPTTVAGEAPVPATTNPPTTVAPSTTSTVPATTTTVAPTTTTTP